jgi:hypothetical protein
MGGKAIKRNKKELITILFDALNYNIDKSKRAKIYYQKKNVYLESL